MVLIGIALLEVGWCVRWLGGIGQGGIRANLLRGRSRGVSSQAPELGERKIGITPFDCPVIISEGQTDRAEQLPRWGLAGRRRSP